MDTNQRLDLAVAAGVIPESPVEAEAYRLGMEHGRTSTQSTSATACWACGRSARKPTLEEQVKELAELHYQRSSIYHWIPAEFEALRAMLEPGDLLAAVVSRVPFYGTVRVIRAGITVDIPRRTLQDLAREEKP